MADKINYDSYNQAIGNKYDISKSILLEPPGSKIPPHSNEAEVAVLGAMMLDRSAISKVIETLEPESFYHEGHKRLYETMLGLFDRGIPVDILTLGEALHRKNLLEYIGGSYYLTDILARTPTAANIEYYAVLVKEKQLKRLLISTANKVINRSYDDTSDALEEVDSAEQMIFEIGEKRFSHSYSSLKKISAEAFQLISKLSDRDKPGISGVPTGFTDLDEILGGFQRSDLIVIAGRPSMGKTALALSIARNTAVQYNNPIGFFSIEMSAFQLAVRLISSEANIGQQKIRNGMLKQEDLSKIVQVLGWLAEAPIFIDDSPALSIMELRAKARRMKAEHKIKMVVVDYLQLIHAPKSESREREISMISRSLKQIAKELDLPVVALAQLNRSVESRSDKKPMLSDLRESGSIEQDADVVMFINRPEVYGKKTFDNDTPAEGKAEVIIGKQRNGPTGSIFLAYEKEFARFINLEFQHDGMPPEMVNAINDEPF